MYACVDYICPLEGEMEFVVGGEFVVEGEFVVGGEFVVEGEAHRAQRDIE